jgi:hypothetical protein
MTVRKILKRNGKARRRTRKKPYLLKTYKRARLKRYKALKVDKTVDPIRIYHLDKATFKIGHDGLIT